jgi:hypothetical protein
MEYYRAIGLDFILLLASVLSEKNFAPWSRGKIRRWNTKWWKICSLTYLGGSLVTTTWRVLSLWMEVSSRGQPKRCGTPAGGLGVGLTTPHRKHFLLLWNVSKRLGPGEKYKKIKFYFVVFITVMFRKWSLYRDWFLPVTSVRWECSADTGGNTRSGVGSHPLFTMRWWHYTVLFLYEIQFEMVKGRWGWLQDMEVTYIFRFKFGGLEISHVTTKEQTNG